MKNLKTFVACLFLVGCTSNHCSRQWGGESHIDLPAGQKLVNATWKDDDLWFVTRAMTPADKPETYNFRESSSFGMLEGVVVIQEQR